MPETYDDGVPVESTERVATLARNLKFLHGFNHTSGAVRAAVSGSSIFHYHGHVLYNAQSALDSALPLADFEKVPPRYLQQLTARDFFSLKLSEPALASIVGCGSGMTSISNTDDILGIPTALFYAGASAVVSTLWPLEDEDGAAFAALFYGAVDSAIRETTEGDRSAAFFGNTVNLARAMRSAILSLRGDPDRTKSAAPYHWAAFTLNGFWMLPARIFEA